MPDEDAPTRGFGMRGGASSSPSKDEGDEQEEPQEQLLGDDDEVDVESEMESIHTD